MNIRRSVAATVVVLSALALAACSSDGDEKTAADPIAALKESGVLKVGAEGTYAPFTFHIEIFPFRNVVIYCLLTAGWFLYAFSTSNFVYFPKMRCLRKNGHVDSLCS